MLEVFVKLTTQQHYEVQIVENSQKYMATPLLCLTLAIPPDGLLLSRWQSK